MADDINDISVTRSLDQIKQGIADIGTASRAIDKDLRDVQKNLRLDPTNTELLAEKQKLLADKLKLSQQNSEELAAAIAKLNAIKAEDRTDGQTKELELYNRKLIETGREITALTGATKEQVETNKNAEESTKSFSQSMTEFQSNLTAAKRIMSGVDSTFKLFGGDPNSTMGQMIKQGQQAVSMMSGIASMGKFLGQSNTAVAKTFGNVAFMAGTAAATFQLASSFINLFGEDSRTVAKVMIGVGSAATIAALGIAIFKGTLSRGLGALAIAGAAAAAAGIIALTRSAKSDVAEFPDTIDVATSSSVSTPTVPSYSSGGSSGGGGTMQSQTIVQTLSEKQIEEAVSRAIINTGLNQKEYVANVDIDGRQLMRLTFNDWIAIWAERGGSFAPGGGITIR